MKGRRGRFGRWKWIKARDAFSWWAQTCWVLWHLNRAAQLCLQQWKLIACQSLSLLFSSGSQLNAPPINLSKTIRGKGWLARQHIWFFGRSGHDGRKYTASNKSSEMKCSGSNAVGMFALPWSQWELQTVVADLPWISQGLRMKNRNSDFFLLLDGSSTYLKNEGLFHCTAAQCATLVPCLLPAAGGVGGVIRQDTGNRSRM